LFVQGLSFAVLLLYDENTLSGKENFMKTIRMEDMNWPDIKAAMEKGYTTAVIGIGSTEQHGPHLPIKTDSLIGDAAAFWVAQKMGHALQAPTIITGCSDHHLAFPGTISLRPSTLKAIIHDYVNSLERHGFKRIVLIPSHGGNFSAVQESAEELRKKFPRLKIAAFVDLNALIDALNGFSAEYGISAEESGAHAGESETSLILALAGNLVLKDRFKSGYLGPLGEKEVALILEKGMPGLSEIGVLGDPTEASAEKGMVYLEKLADYILEEIKGDL
jgi:creatinine amidohydrolase